MWANQDVADFLAWLHQRNVTRLEHERVGFYGLAVYSLWDSLRETISWLEANAPDAVPAAMRAWRCFVPYREDPHEYARSTRLVPESCEADVVALLVEVRRRTHERTDDDEDPFDAAQNAEVAAEAEHYYRIMVRGDRESWNIRASTWPTRSTGWRNTHIGDARATDMCRDGLVNVGQLVRERHAADGVALVGFASHRGSVLAAEAWGTPERVFPVPDARCPRGQSRGSPPSRARKARRPGVWRRPIGSLALCLVGSPGDRGRLPTNARVR